MPTNTIAYTWISTLAHIAASRGIEVSHIRNCMGITDCVATTPGSRITARQSREFWRLVVAHLDDRFIGIEVGNMLEPKAFPGLGTAIQSAQNLEHAIRIISELSNCISHDFKLSAIENKGLWYVRFRSVAMPSATFFERLAWAVFLMKLARTLPPQSICAKELRFRGELPVDIAELILRLGCHVVSNAEDDAVVFHMSDRDIPFEQYDPVKVVYGLTIGHYYIDGLSHPDSFSERICRQINLVLERTEPKLTVVAAELGMSVRTLQRKLDQENLSYGASTDAVKSHMMTTLLTQTNAPILRISQLLRFSEPSSLTRACMRWFQLTPINYKKKLMLLERRRQHLHIN